MRTKVGTATPMTLTDGGHLATEAECEKLEMAIGRMIVSFAHLEGIVAAFICSLVGGDRTQVMALIAGQTLRQLLPRVSAQVRLAVPTRSDYHQGLDTWITRAEKAADRRNRFVHDQLVFRADEEDHGLHWAIRRSHTTKKEGFRTYFVPTTVDEVRGLSTEIEALGAALILMIDELIEEGLAPITARYSLVRVD